MIRETKPVKVFNGGRHLRAWGRDYEFDAAHARLVKRLVRAYRDGFPLVATHSRLPADHPAVLEGAIKCTEGVYSLQEPIDSPYRETLVITHEIPDPRSIVDSESLALAVLQMNPHWSDQQIADYIGINRTSLYRYERFKAARAMLKEGRQAFREWQQT